MRLSINISYPIDITGVIELKSGLLTCLRGPSGTGKTTVIYEIIHKIRENYIFVTQNNLLLDDLTIQENFDIFSISQQDILSYLHLFKINIDPNTFVSMLSEGEKQRIILAIALARKPKYLFLDEPLSHVDLENKKNTIQIIKDYTRKYGCITLMVNHAKKFDEYADIVYTIEDHKINLIQSCDFTIDYPYNSKMYKIKIRTFVLHKIKRHRFMYVLSGMFLVALFILPFSKNILKHTILNTIDDHPYVILQGDQLENNQNYFSFLQDYNYTSCQYNDIEGKIYPFISDEDSYLEEYSHGLFVSQNNAERYHIQIGDVVLVDKTFMEIMGILDSSFQDPISSNELFFYSNKDLKRDCSNRMIGILKDITDYKNTFHELKMQHLDIDFADIYTKTTIEYVCSKITVIQNIYVIIYMIIIGIYILFWYKNVFLIHNNIAYLWCNSVAKYEILLCFFSLELWIATVLEMITFIYMKNINIQLISALMLSMLVTSLCFLNNRSILKKIR